MSKIKNGGLEKYGKV